MVTIVLCATAIGRATRFVTDISVGTGISVGTVTDAYFMILNQHRTIRNQKTE